MSSQTVKSLRAKQAELMRMREAINELTSGAGTQTAPDDYDEEEEDDDEEDDEAAAEEAALVAQLQRKRDELQRMQSAIARLEAAEAEAEAAEESQNQTEEEDDDEPKSEQEWLTRLLKQQQELQQLRSAIAAAKEGAYGASQEDDLKLHDIDEAEEEEDEEEDDEDDEAQEAEMRDMLAKLNGKRDELNELLQMKAQLQERLEAHAAGTEAPAPPPPPQMPAPAPAQRNGREDELRAVLQHRMEAQQAVDEQEQKIAHLTALQADLRTRLADMEAGEEEEVEEEVEEDDEAIAPASGDDDDGLAERVLELLAVKTDECQQLAAVVEEARTAGMDPSNPRLQLAEHNLATRYQEIKELAAFAHRLGLTMDDDEEEEEEEEESSDPEAEAALAKVQRLQQELEQCVHELRTVDANASPAVAKNPAFLKMRAMVVSKLEALHGELTEARDAYERMGQSKALVVQKQQVQEEEQPEEVDLSPMLRAALDKLWQRPYDCRIFTLQLLQSLAQLDNASLCMMTSCFARYLEVRALLPSHFPACILELCPYARCCSQNHSVPA